ncbi:MAG: amidase [Kiloniellales bacterium]
MSDDPTKLSAGQLLARYKKGDLSPVEATKAALARIERHDKTLNAFVLVDGEQALAEAAKSEERWRIGATKGRLDGVPTSIKDMSLSKGWPTRRGSRTTPAEGPWEEDAPLVARLREHGAILLGKTATPEFGWKGVTDSPLTGITRNPWNPGLTPGGSSGGAAAALAAGFCTLASGGDGGGSIRIPAAMTGVVGLKPTYGRVPAYPGSPYGQLTHSGPMARSVADAALMLTVMAEPDPRDGEAIHYDGNDFSQGLNKGVKGLKIAFSPTLCGHRVEPEVAKLVAAAAERFGSLGATVEEIDPPLEGCTEPFLRLWLAKMASQYAPLDAKQRKLLDPGFVELAEEGLKLPLLDYLAAERARADIARAMSLFHERYYLLLTPTLPLVAFAAGIEVPPGYRQWYEWTPFTYPFNMSHQPAISLPCGLTSTGLPVGLQIVGPRFADAMVLRAARAFEATMPAPVCPLAA